ncbi:MAG: LiaF transmembrane domain-containing protein [Bacteroidia bacterium]
MENFNQRKMVNSNSNGRVLAGVILLGVGVVLFAHELKVEMPVWLYSWGTFWIAVGLFLGAKSTFKRSGWMIPVFIGIYLLLDDLIIGFNLKDFFWPTIILLAGAAMIISPFKRKHWEKKYQNLDNSDLSEDYLDTTSIFGGVKKNILTKNFKGGQVFNVFGGVEIDLTQSDIDGIVVLDITQVFGGTKLILPSHWEVKTEITAIIGGVDDKRKNLSALNIAEGKTLILRGTSVFAGIDIKSF